MSVLHIPPRLLRLVPDGLETTISITSKLQPANRFRIMGDFGQVDVRCIVQGLKPEQLKADDTFKIISGTLVQVFETEVRNKFQLPYKIDIHKSRKDHHGNVVVGDKITSFSLNVKKGDTLFAIYDTNHKVVGGGFGGGATVQTMDGQVAQANGGIGTGGRRTANGNELGGTGVGGTAYGAGKTEGEGGAGMGAPVAASKAGQIAMGGAGVGGIFDPRKPPSQAEQKR